MHTTRSVRPLSVCSDGKNIVSRADTTLLAQITDRSGLTKEMSGAVAGCGISWKTHDPGVVLTHLAVTIADGADCISDLSELREQSELFGTAASGPRAIEAVASVELREIRRAVAAAQQRYGRHSLRGTHSYLTSTPPLSLLIRRISMWQLRTIREDLASILWSVV